MVIDGVPPAATADELDEGQRSAADLPEGVSLAVAAVARRLGVAPATLRTWDRRYGLGPSSHEAGSHRRYTSDDLARLEAMQRLLLMGAPPAEAARCALSHGDPMATATAEVPTVTTAAPGGTAALVRGLSRAASALDSASCGQLVADSVARRGVVGTWTDVLAPTLVDIGQKWESTGVGVEVEHLLSESIIAVMQSVVAALKYPVNQRSVLLSCAPNDLHTIPLFALAAALAERRVSSRFMGARVPHEALLAAARRVGPGAILVWSQLAETGDASPLADLADLRPTPLVLLGGPGWQHDTSSVASPVADLHEAVTRICATVCL